MPTADVSDRIGRLCLHGLPAKALREQIIAVLRGVMSFEAHNFPLTDPVTMVGTSPFADVPMLPWPRLPELIRWRYQTIPQRWDTLVESGPTTSLLAGGSPETASIWVHVQRDLGVVDTATTVCADRYGCWGFLDLWRTTTAFTPTELSFLASLAPVLARGLRESVARTFVEADSTQEQIGPAVVVLGPDLQVHAQTAGAAARSPSAPIDWGRTSPCQSNPQRRPSGSTCSDVHPACPPASPRYSRCWPPDWKTSRSPPPSSYPSTPRPTT